MHVIVVNEQVSHFSVPLSRYSFKHTLNLVKYQRPGIMYNIIAKRTVVGNGTWLGK